MGTNEEFDKMLDFMVLHEIIPEIDEVIPFNESDKAFAKMQEGSQTGKIVLSFENMA